MSIFSQIFKLTKSEEVNSAELRDTFFNNLYSDYSEFLNSSGVPSWINRFIVWDARCKGKTPNDNLQRTNIRWRSIINDYYNNDVSSSVWEFFEIFSTEESKDVRSHIYKLIHYNGESGTWSGLIVEDKIYRFVLQWFWERMTDEGKAFYENCGCDPDIDKDNKKITNNNKIKVANKQNPDPLKVSSHEGKIESEIKNNGTEASRIITIIRYILSQYNNEGLLYPLANFLQIRNYMRNYTAHELRGVLDENQRKKALKITLFANVGLVFALRFVLLNLNQLQEEFRDYLIPDGFCQLTVFHDEGEDVVIIDNESGDTLEGIAASDGWKEYQLRRTGNYKIQVAKTYLDRIPPVYLCQPNPVAEVKRERIILFSSEKDMDGSSQRTKRVAVGNAIINTERNTGTLVRWVRIGVIFLCIIGILGLIFLRIPLHEDIQSTAIFTVDKRSPNELILKGDSLLNLALWKQDYDLCEQAGNTYRKAIDHLRLLAEQPSTKVAASLDLCHMYMSGKGCYNLDSAFYFAQIDEVRATKEGQGLYAYLLFKRGQTEQARREISRAIDDEDEYIRITKALNDMHNAITKSSSKLTCENAYLNLSKINNDDAKYERALIDLWGVRNREDTHFLLHPNFGEAYNTFYELGKRNPSSLMVLGDIHRLLNDAENGIFYHYAAFCCGHQQEAAIAINLSFLFHSDSFTPTGFDRDIMEKMAGLSNVIGGVGGLLSDYVHFIDSKDYDLAIKTADSLFVLTHQQDNNAKIIITDTTYISRIQITSRLLTGEHNDFSEAVHLAMKRDNCTDSIAVADYLKGVCYAKGYGCTIDIKKSDDLILQSAKRGTYTESLATYFKRHPPITGSNIEQDELWDFYLSPVLLKKSPKLVSVVGTLFISDIVDINYLYDYQIEDKLIPFFPKVWVLMNQSIVLLEDFLREKKKPFMGGNGLIVNCLTSINDYISIAMKDGLSDLAQNGCLQYSMFAEIVNMQQNIDVYNRFSLNHVVLPGAPPHDIKESDLAELSKYNFYHNPLPQYPDYAY